MSKYLLIAKHKEDTTWTRSLPAGWVTMTYHAGLDEYHPNSKWGCEAFSYLRMILDNYDFFEDEDVVAFCQGDPFPHCPFFMADLDEKPIQGRVHHCKSCGGPHCDYLDLDAYCKVIGLKPMGCYTFSEGAHFKTTGKAIKSHPKEFYKALYNLCSFQHPLDPKWHAMSLERLWLYIFDII